MFFRITEQRLACHVQAEGRKLQEITDIFSVIYQAQGVPSGSVEVPGATFIAPGELHVQPYLGNWYWHACLDFEVSL